MTAEPLTPYRWTREHYEQAVEAGLFDDDRVELLEGEIVPMSPQSEPHASTTRWLRRHLDRGLDPDVWLVGGQDPVALSDWSEPEPDVWVGHAEIGRAHPRPSAMSLIVEVSWSSAQRDRVRKLRLYGAAGVAEYWIVDLHNEVVYVHRDPTADGYRTVTTAARGDSVTVPRTDLQVEVNALLGPERSLRSEHQR